MFNFNKKLIVATTFLVSILGIFNCAFANEKLSAQQHLANAKAEFYREKAKNPVFRRELYDVNYNIRYNNIYSHNRNTLDTETAWKAVMEKAWNPVKYIPHAILKGVVLKDTIKEDDKAAFFVRLSVQNPFIKGEKGIKGDKSEFTVVREEVSIDKVNGIVYFMGRVPEASDYQVLSVKASDANPQIMFLVEHKIVKTDNDPFDDWTLVAMPTQGFKSADQQYFVDNLGQNINPKPHSIYLQAQKLLK